MTSDLISTLNRESDQLVRSLDQKPLLRALFAGTIDVAGYVTFLVQTYHYVRWTSPLLAVAGRRLVELGQHPALAALFCRKASEEDGHATWVLADLRALGEGVACVDRQPPSSAVRAYIAWNQFTVQADQPTAFLGTAYVLEYLAAERAGRAVANLLSASGTPRAADALRFLRGHAAVDGGHLQGLVDALRPIEDPTEQDAIVLSARTTRVLYADFFST